MVPAQRRQLLTAPAAPGACSTSGACHRGAGTGNAAASPAPAAGGERDRLTPREREIVSALARGETNKEIARQLEITERTVKAHVSAMLEKLGARDRLQLSLIVNGVETPR